MSEPPLRHQIVRLRRREGRGGGREVRGGEGRGGEGRRERVGSKHVVTCSYYQLGKASTRVNNEAVVWPTSMTLSMSLLWIPTATLISIC